jgi:CRP-like cAMP-binding protein
MHMPDERQLREMPPFCRLVPQQLRDALDLAEARHFTGGALVFDEGQPARRFHLLLSGHIRFVRLTAAGEQIIVLHIPAGQMFGIGAALGQVTHQATAIAAGNCRVLSWPNALWPVFTRKYDGFSAETLRSFGAQADEMSDRIVELSTKVVEQRIACALLRMIGQSGRKVAAGIEIGFPISRQNIADMTGTTLHTVSRLLSAWEKQGLVESSRCHVVVTDPHRIVMLSGAAERPAGGNPVRPPYDADMADARSAARKVASSSPYSRQASITV